MGSQGMTGSMVVPRVVRRWYVCMYVSLKPTLAPAPGALSLPLPILPSTCLAGVCGEERGRCEVQPERMRPTTPPPKKSGVFLHHTPSHSMTFTY